MVGDDLVDDDLGKQRRRQADELDGKTGQQHVAPDGFVAQQLGNKPGKAKGFLLLRCNIRASALRFVQWRLCLGHQDKKRQRLRSRHVVRQNLRLGLARLDPGQRFFTITNDQRRDERAARLACWHN